MATFLCGSMVLNMKPFLQRPIKYVRALITLTLLTVNTVGAMQVTQEQPTPDPADREAAIETYREPASCSRICLIRRQCIYYDTNLPNDVVDLIRDYACETQEECSQDHKAPAHGLRRLQIYEQLYNTITSLPTEVIGIIHAYATDDPLYDEDESKIATCIKLMPTEYSREISYLEALPNGLLASASWRGLRDENNPQLITYPITIWDTTSETKRHFLNEHTHAITCLLYLGNNLLASADFGGIICLWDIEHGELLGKMKNDGGIACLLHLNQDHLLIAGSQQKGIVNVWDYEKQTCVRSINDTTQQCQAKHSVPPLHSGITCLLLISSQESSHTIAIATWKPTITIIDRLSPTQERLTGTTLRGHSDGVTQLVKLTENKIASASWDKTVKIWNTDTTECLRTLTHLGSVIGLVKLSDHCIASASEEGRIMQWNLDTRTKNTTKENFHGGEIFPLTDGLIMFKSHKNSTGNNEIFIIDANTGTLVKCIIIRSSISCVVPLRDNPGALAVGTSNGSIHIWKLT